MTKSRGTVELFGTGVDRHWSSLALESIGSGVDRQWSFVGRALSVELCVFVGRALSVELCVFVGRALSVELCQWSFVGRALSVERFGTGVDLHWGRSAVELCQ